LIIAVFVRVQSYEKLLKLEDVKYSFLHHIHKTMMLLSSPGFDGINRLIHVDDPNSQLLEACAVVTPEKAQEWFK
jgi:hypothetical protein